MAERCAPRPQGFATPPWRVPPWASVPTPAEAARCGAYPDVFVDAGPAGRRYPIGVRSVSLPAAGVAALLVEFIADRHGGLDRRGHLLIREVAEQLTVPSGDMLRVDVAASPNGDSLDDELHLLVRYRDGSTVRLAVTGDVVVSAGDAVVSVGSTGGAAGDLLDPICLAGGHPDPVQLAVSHTDDAAFGARVAAITTLISGFLPVNNNDDMAFLVAVEPHGLALSEMDGVTADAAFRRWWEAPARASLRENWWAAKGYNDGPVALLDPRELAAMWDEFERDTVKYAVLIARDFHESDESPTGGEPAPPEAHLVCWLIRDLAEQLTKRVAGPASGAPILVYMSHWREMFKEPADDPSDPLVYDDPSCQLVLMGPERAALVTVYAPM